MVDTQSTNQHPSRFKLVPSKKTKVSHAPKQQPKEAPEKDLHFNIERFPIHHFGEKSPACNSSLRPGDLIGGEVGLKAFSADGFLQLLLHFCCEIAGKTLSKSINF